MVLLHHARHGAANEISLDVGAQLEELANLLEGQRGDDSSAMRAECHQPFCFELSKRLADRYAADAELYPDRILAQRFSFGKASAQDPFANRIGCHSGERL